MGVSKSVLGMNARNFLFIRRYNSGTAKWRADDKLVTKQLLIKHRIATPKLISKFTHPDDIKNFDWQLPSDGFVIKPARGYGGGGILVIKSWDGEIAVTTTGETFTKKQLRSHLYDIFDGAFSLQYIPDNAFIEQLVHPSMSIKKIGTIGVPDIRVIVFRRIPVMAMMRVPTVESKGKANLHMGAIGVGIDIRTGITTHSLYKNRIMNIFPQTKKKLSGISVPHWHDILLLASKIADVSKLGFVGIDIVIDEKEGPLVLEINARPGLNIQKANLSSLRTRMERVEDVYISTPERAVEIAQSLFSDKSSDRVKTSPKILTVIQPITIYGQLEKGLGIQKETVLAKLDTGAYRTSIDKKLAKKLRLPVNDKKVLIQSASGTAYRNTVNLTFEMAGKKIKSVASIVDRSHLNFSVIIGRQDLQGFIISPDFGEYQDSEKELEKINP